MAGNAMIKRHENHQIAAVLFDIGGPIDTEIEFEREADRLIGAAFAAHRHSVAAAAIVRASEIAVVERAPNAYLAMIDHLAAGDAALATAVTAKFRADLAKLDLFEKREGIDDVLRWLHARGLKLGVVANQPQRKIEVLGRAGLARYFTDLQMSEGIGRRKPDPEIFRHVCRALAVEPAQCVMVGDRIDNDIMPANRLGMTTIQLRAGRHRDQRPIAAEDFADFIVEDCAGLRTALASVLP